VARVLEILDEVEGLVVQLHLNFLELVFLDTVAATITILKGDELDRVHKVSVDELAHTRLHLPDLFLGQVHLQRTL